MAERLRHGERRGDRCKNDQEYEHDEARDHGLPAANR